MIHQCILGTDLFINNYQMGGWTKQKWDLFNVFIKNTTNWPFHVIHSNFNVAEWFMCPMTRKGSFRSTGHGAVKLGVKAVSQGIETCCILAIQWKRCLARHIKSYLFRGRRAAMASPFLSRTTSRARCRGMTLLVLSTPFIMGLSSRCLVWWELGLPSLGQTGRLRKFRCFEHVKMVGLYWSSYIELLNNMRL